MQGEGSQRDAILEGSVTDGLKGAGERELLVNSISASCRHPAKEPYPIFVRPAGRVILVSEVPQNAPSPMLVRLAGRLIETRDAQPSKAWSPMLVSVAGSASLASEVSPRKAPSLMVVRSSGRRK